MPTIRIIRTDRNVDAVVFTGEALLIGRAAACELPLPHPSVAPVHAGIKWHEDVYWLSALAEPVILLNGEAVRSAPLVDGAIVRFGAYLVRVTLTPEQLQLTVEFALGLVPGGAVDDAPAAAEPATEIAEALAQFWAERLRAAPALARSAQTDTAKSILLPAASADVRRRWPRKVAFGTVLFVLALAMLTGLAFPRAYAPGPLSVAHARQALTVTPALALKPSQGCTSCHGLTGSLQNNCTACHTTPNFQPAVGAMHTALNQNCRTCHTEHQGADFKLTSLPNALCASCHRAASGVTAAAGKVLGQPHGNAVAYPVKRGVWSWDGISQTDWVRHGLPGLTTDYNLREQFHMLHTQGTRLGRAQCSDCHLGGYQQGKSPGEKNDPAWKLNVRESCSQCHTLQPALTAELARLEEQSQPLLAGQTRCVACHVQHGPEKDLRASTRRNP